jgi:hypothetical protein
VVGGVVTGDGAIAAVGVSGVGGDDGMRIGVVLVAILLLFSVCCNVKT